jgi:EAL domain-containing protein (putative c-di-GMP-specific phosphodiesterase class I)
VTSITDLIRASVAASDGTHDDIVQDALHSIRMHLGMDVAFLGEFRDGERVFRRIDTELDLPIRAGDSHPLEETYCQRAVDGRLPLLIPDTSMVPEAMAMPVTAAFGIGAYLTAPILLTDGSVYGTLCCVSFAPDPSLGERDIALLKMFGGFVGRQLERSVASGRSSEEASSRIRMMLELEDFSIVYQPIYDLVHDRVVGFEALTRFATQPLRAPDVWFDEAARAGLGEQLEVATIAKAIEELAQLPKHIFVSLNMSPENIINGAVARMLEGAPLKRIVLEITEHESVDDYAKLGAALAPLRERGLRVAVDDAGAGYASFRHILKLEPDVIKLDISITRDIDTQISRRALAAALIRFAEETGSRIVAEGVETEAELAVLRELRVNKAQGFLIGRPVPIAAAAEMVERNSSFDSRVALAG